MRDLRKELEEESLDEPPVAWKPEVGDVLVGTLRGYSSAKGYRDRDVFVAKIEVEGIVEGSPFVSVWLLHAVLLGEFKKLRPAPGERLAIKYGGKRESAEGAEFHFYRVIVDRVGETAVPEFGEGHDEGEVGAAQ